MPIKSSVESPLEMVIEEPHSVWIEFSAHESYDRTKHWDVREDGRYNDKYPIRLLETNATLKHFRVRSAEIFPTIYLYPNGHTSDPVEFIVTPISLSRCWSPDDHSTTIVEPGATIRLSWMLINAHGVPFHNLISQPVLMIG